MRDQYEESDDWLDTDGSCTKTQPVRPKEFPEYESEPASVRAQKTKPIATTPQPRRIHAVIANLPVQFRNRHKSWGHHRPAGWVFSLIVSRPRFYERNPYGNPGPIPIVWPASF